MKGYQFGTFKGVFTPSILTILGVIMYLRFGWVLGQVGLVETLLIVTLATAITFLTALSISSLATNMKIGGGGAYYIISRSLGLETGAAIGIPLFFAQAIGVSFYIAGFSESVASFFPDWPIHQLGIVVLCVLALLALFSADLALKIQFVILTLIIGSLVSFFMGAWDPSTAMVRQASAEPIIYLPFWAVFAVFFPAVTGIEAGLSMSGDLKNPSRSLPLGTLGAVGVSYLVYLAIPIFLTNLNIDPDMLITNSLMMKEVARWGQWVYLGLWGAALSSAMGGLLGAPRTLQALSRDHIVPRWLGRQFGDSGDPRIATAITFMIAAVGIMLGDLNMIAPVLSMFFLTSYGLLNFAAAFNGMMNNPSWRPTFRVHWVFSLLGFMGCVMVMFMINPGATFIAYALSGLVYYLMKKRKLNAYWGDIRHGILMYFTRLLLYKITEYRTHEHTWRPNILVLSGSPTSHWHLIAIADAISHGKGLLTVASIVPDGMFDGERLENLQESLRKFLKERSVPAVVKVSKADNVFDGARGLVENYGFGPLVPNTVLLGEVGKNEDKVHYASLILSITRRLRNLIIVNEREKKSDVILVPTIDLWWRRVGDNSGLMLVLGYLLKTSPEWRGARLRIQTIVDDASQQDDYIEQLTTFVTQANVEAEVGVFLLEGKSAFDLIKEKSQEADMVFLGMRAPDEDETAEEYSHYYENLLLSIQDLPTTALVLASENIDFKKIFELKEAY